MLEHPCSNIGKSELSSGMILFELMPDLTNPVTFLFLMSAFPEFMLRTDLFDWEEWVGGV
jgi:hypothetical protein